LLNQSGFAPRMSLAIKTGDNSQVSLAYGLFYQDADNNTLLWGYRPDFQQAVHYIANWQLNKNDRTLRIEGYYETYNDLVREAVTNGPYDANPYHSLAGLDINNSGYGYATGAELFWRDKKSFKDFDYWVSYSYLDTKRDYLNYPEELQPNFAAHHTASIVMKKFVTKWKAGFNVTYSFATGRPYYDFLYNVSDNKYSIADEGKTKNYNNMGFSAEYLPNLGNTKAKTFIVLFASVTNILGQNQVYGYNYSFNGLNKEPILPPAKRFYFIGCFLSWGIDRSQDAINNNL